MSAVSDDFYASVLTAVHAPVTTTTLYLCHAWQACEGGDAAHNPWNTTQPEYGASDYNSAGVKSYPDAATGVHATVVTLTNGRYGAILTALCDEDASAFGDAVDASPWGTHGVADYLIAHPAPEPGTPATRTGDDIVTALPMLAQGAGMPPKPANVHVATVQALCGVQSHPVSTDGRFGPSTDAAVRGVQSAAGITVDGVVGPHTWRALLFLTQS